jgi:hypothetical protein
MKRTSVILIAIGLILLGVAAYLLVREAAFLQGAQRASALVTGNQQYAYTGNYNEYGLQHYYCSSFRFQTGDGRTVDFKQASGSSSDCGSLDRPPDYQVGQHVQVYYDSSDPAGTVQLPGDVKLAYSGIAILAVAGTICALLGLVLFWGARLEVRTPEPARPARR